MGFTTACFINKNTKYLRNELKKIGYCVIGKSLPCIKTNVSVKISIAEQSYEFELNGRIDCGTNEDLFLAIAALREDSDINQWFVLDTSVSWASENFHPKGTFILCKRDKWNVDIDKNGNHLIFSSRNIPAHKANVKELIQHFK